MIIHVKPHIYTFCLELDNGKIHRSQEFMDIWHLIEFYKPFNIHFNFYLEEKENGI